MPPGQRMMKVCLKESIAHHLISYDMEDVVE